MRDDSAELKDSPFPPRNRRCFRSLSSADVSGKTRHSPQTCHARVQLCDGSFALLQALANTKVLDKTLKQQPYPSVLNPKFLHGGILGMLPDILEQKVTF